MARADILNILYSRDKSALEFNFDSLMAPPIQSVLPGYAVEKLYNIATSIRYASNVKFKYEAIRDVLQPFDFRQYHAGTNRVIYKHLEITNIVAKVAMDVVGMKDNPAEYKNQYMLKPFVTKTFDIDQTGVIAFAERVEPITSRLQMASVGESIYDLITNNIVGMYILEDIGTKYFRNWGLRIGFGPVLLDYPRVFELDGNKLYCNKEMNPITGEICGGEIDYDEGFNKIICKKCGKAYNAKMLEKSIENHDISIESSGSEFETLKARVVKGNKTLYTFGYVNETSVIKRNKRNSKI